LQEFQASSGLTAAEIGLTVSATGVGQAGPEVLLLWQQKLAELQVKRSSMKQFLREDSPEIQSVDAEIRAVEGQVASRKKDLLPNGGAKGLSQARLEFANLMYEAAMNKEMFLGAIRATTEARAEASRTLKRVDMVQAPTLPVRPDRGSMILNLFWAVLVGGLSWRILGQIKRYVESHND
jgi:capsular polysaccharide transport system permease protein